MSLIFCCSSADWEHSHFPVLLFALAWKWLRSETIEAQTIKSSGHGALILGACTAFSLGPQWRPFGGAVSARRTGRHAARRLPAQQFQYDRSHHR